MLEGESRRDNCEYPWEILDANGNVVGIQSPLDHSFSPSSMVRDPGTITLLKAVRSLVAEISA